MVKGRLGTILGWLRQVTVSETDAGLTDGRLLERFARTGDEAAFDALLARHGPLVLGVCRRLLPDHAAADDAFQATFLILVRKAAALDGDSSLAGWLYTVAYRVALRARAAARRRRHHEEQSPVREASDPSAEAAWRDLRPVLDEELNRLPEKYRQPVLLCYLEGKTHAAAAAELGWPKGTVAGRLARARELLRARLSRRGLALSTTALTAALTGESAAAALPAVLAAATRRAALLPATGKGVAATVSVRVTDLIEGVTRTMKIHKLTTTLLALALGGLLATGAGVLARQLLAARPGEDEPSQGAAASAGRKREEAKGLRGHSANDPLPAGAVARLGTLRFRTEGAATALAFFPDGKTLALATRGRTVELLSVPDGKALPQLAGATRPAFSIAVSPHGNLLAAGGYDGQVRVWDTATKRLLHEMKGHQGAVGALAFSADGKLLASAGRFDDTPRLWDPAHGKEVRRVGNAERGVQAVAFSPDGKTLATGAGDGKVRLLDIASGKERHAFTGHTDKVASVAFAPDGKTLASGGEDSALRLWDTGTGKELHSIKGGEGAWVTSVAFSPDGRVLAAAMLDGTIRRLDAATLKEHGRFTRSINTFAALAFSRDGKRLAAIGEDQRVSLWDAVTGKDLTPAGGHGQGVVALALLAGGKALATAGADRTVRLWDVAGGKERHRLEEEVGVSSLAAAPDGKLLACGDGDGVVLIRDADSGKVLHRVEAHKGVVSALTFTADGKALVSWSQQRTVHVWDVAGEKGRRIEARLRLDELPLDTPVGAVAPDGKTLFVGGDDGRIRVVESATGKEAAVLGGGGKAVLGVAVSPDGKTLASVGLDKALCLWEVKTGKEVRRAPLADVSGALAFSPDGQRLAIGSFAGVILLWDLTTGKETGRLEGHRGRIASLAFSADGNRLVSGSEDTTALVWDVSTAGKGR